MGLLSAIAGILKPAPPPDPTTAKALERIVELVDPLLGAAPGFAHKLAAPVHHSLGYCEGLVDGLPGPIDINRHAFGADPLVHALFATADDISRMLGNSQAVRDYLADPGCYASDHFYALFAARRQEKHQLGLARQGEVIRSDVPQTVLYFRDQVLVEPNCDFDATRACLKAAAFDSLLKSFHSHVEALRLEKYSLAADRSVESAHLTVLRGKSEATAITVSTRHLAELETHLRQVAESLMPEQLEEALAAYLLSPEKSLRLDPVTINVDRLGILSEQANAQEVATLRFPELTARDQRRHLVMLARIDREEAREAVEASLDRQRRFLII
ncbi:MAG: hypothetical protein H6R10_1734 [Rhodocyclaceae bacterium]|nr:hypothetical protein [Rhodocyclaceae bacterium]